MGTGNSLYNHLFDIVNSYFGLEMLPLSLIKKQEVVLKPNSETKDLKANYDLNI